MSGDHAESDELRPTNREIIDTASDAAEGLVFSRYKQSDVTDLDVTVQFEEGTLNVDVYLNAPKANHDPEQIVTDAVSAAEAAVDELFASYD
jgi:hypothetical protein